ncbi:MAG: hypothetical protein U5L72_14420 [Bacteroidales bacterium]|nr:hypothetical protein [Bacteroidales bacterium]
MIRTTDKKISGGQRKRLNIGLELMREPAVLFADEPISGLASHDSENVMDLLKDQAMNGKLVFVIIHQPSSDILKMFDRLWLLDRGGYMIYDGDPVDAIVYFKTETSQANAAESECPTCGNVETDEILQIVEAKVVDPDGRKGEERQVSPVRWYHSYRREDGARPERHIRDETTARQQFQNTREAETASDLRQEEPGKEVRRQAVYGHKPPRTGASGFYPRVRVKIPL